MADSEKSPAELGFSPTLGVSGVRGRPVECHLSEALPNTLRLARGEGKGTLMLNASLDIPYAEAVTNTEEHVLAHAANTHALLACLDICATEELRPYREVEAQLAGHAAMRRTIQSPHTLLSILVDAGGVECVGLDEDGNVIVPQDDEDEGERQTDRAEDEGGDETAEPAEAAAELPEEPTQEATESPWAVDDDEDPWDDEDEWADDPWKIAIERIEREDAEKAAEEAAEQAAAEQELRDQPTDYLVRTSQAGLEVLDRFDVTRRYTMLLAMEPEGYEDAYAKVLEACAEEEGATLPHIEALLEGHPALSTPKTVYAGYFVSKLENVGAIVWDGRWRATIEA